SPFAVTPRYFQVLETPRGRGSGTAWRKLTTAQAHELSAATGILQHCYWRDVPLPILSPEAVIRHWRPEDEFQNVLARDISLQRLLALLDDWLTGPANAEQPSVGITGSRLIGASNPNSDADIVVYGVDQMLLLREWVRESLACGDIRALDEEQWRATFARRGTSLEFDEYLWHERRKYNKFTADRMRVDVSCVAQPPASWKQVGQKLALIQASALVVDASQAFATPAEYSVEHERFSKVVAYTATFVGQATAGERIEVQGWLEQLADGTRQVVVGTSREACGEWIRVIDADAT
ncbi:MAG TPA: hypothetical protein DDW52_14890, partial [Planctomycetaceae bacterium]|nr:hypothetical protein [Planctomycetaceae bacterium]